MDDQPVRSVPPGLIESLDASVRDIAAGAVSDAADVQAEVRRMRAVAVARMQRLLNAGTEAGLYKTCCVRPYAGPAFRKSYMPATVRRDRSCVEGNC